MKIIILLFEIVPLLLFGSLLSKSWPGLSRLLAYLLIMLGIPISLMGILLNLELGIDVLYSAIMSIIFIILAIFGIRCFYKELKLSPHLIMQLGSCFGNTGYIGLPVCLALLPKEALVFSIGYDIGATLLIWSVAPMFLLTDNSFISNDMSKINFFYRSILKSPVIKAIAGSFLVYLSPWTELIAKSLWLPSKICIFLALVVVGMNLSTIRGTYLTLSTDINKLLKQCLINKLVLMPGFAFVFCLVLGSSPLMTKAFVIQAACPTAVSVLLLSEAFQKDMKLTSELLNTSTILFIFTCPIWYSLLNNFV